MFDGVPEFYARRRRDRRLRVGAGVVLFLTAAALVSFGRVAPIAAETVISSPSHLRQVEVFAAPGGEKIFYLHNAGYRLPHKLQLIGIVYGAEGCSVQWQGPDRIRILLHPGWSRLVAGYPKGVAVAFAKAP
jgi:hypothetical protein